MRFYSYLFLLLVMNYANGQTVLFNQYFNNNYLINPAISGIEKYADIQLGTRQQWTGVDGAPKTTYISIHSPLNRSQMSSGFSKVPDYEKPYSFSNRFKGKVHHGLGGFLLSESSGVLNNQEVNLSYAVHIPLRRDFSMAFGASGGAYFTGLDRSKVISTSNQDPLIDGFSNKVSGLYKVGLWTYGKSFYLGLSMTEIYEFEKQYFATAGYRFLATQSKIGFMPFSIVRIADQRNMDFGLKVDWNSRVITSFIYQTTSHIGWSIGFNTSPLFGISYYYIAHENYSGIGFRTHELVLNFRLNNQNKVICPEELW